MCLYPQGGSDVYFQNRFRRTDLSRTPDGGLTVNRHKSLTIADVSALGSALIEVADLYPLLYRTERDFFPLVLSYLHGRVPSVKTEVGDTAGRIDFRVGGPNPALLELAVAARALSDPYHVYQKFPRHQGATQLYASQNRSELRKLKTAPQTQAKNRYLLLLDLRGIHDFSALMEGYKSENRGGGAAIRVVYVKRGESKHFVVGVTRAKRKK